MTNRLTFAIGDIHGCLDQMIKMIHLIDAYIAQNMDKYDHFRVIFLGDYVDRGSNSKGVIDILMTLNRNPRVNVEYIALKGNHEDMFIASCEPENMLPGGIFSTGELHTLKSFGATNYNQVPKNYIDFMKNLPLYFEDDLRVFVHAGIDPNIDNMKDQDPADLIWIRQPFVNSKFPMFKYIVHGHTPYDPTYGVQIWENKANLDTACVFGGDLTCAVFNDNDAKPFDTIVVRNRELIPLGAD